MDMEASEGKQYELCFWIKDDGSGAAPTGVFDSIRAIVEKSGAVMVRDRQPEKRTMAYPIQKQRTAYWCEMLFTGPAESLRAIREGIQYEAAILRKIIVAVQPPKEKKARILKEPRAQKEGGAAALRAEMPQEMQAQLDSKLKEILES